MKIGDFHRTFLYLAIILRYPLNDSDYEANKLLRLFYQDLQFCSECFSTNDQKCLQLQRLTNFDRDFINSINNLFGVKHVSYGKIGESSIVVKYLGSIEKFNYIIGGLCDEDKDPKDCKHSLESASRKNIQSLRRLFLNSKRIDGCQFCPPSHLDNFLGIMSAGNDAADIVQVLVTLNVNAHLLLLPILNLYNFPVPKLYGNCGFTIYESYDGVPLSSCYSLPFPERLKIAEQLLTAAFKFTEGFSGYKIYLTDGNPDNIVYNEQTGKISFVDIDGLIIVDSYADRRQHGGEKSRANELPSTWRKIHRHEMIDCKGCFAYVPTDICSHHESDMNFFTICQLLQEDLYQERDGGFLHSFPDEILKLYPQAPIVLEECVTCTGECENRFKSAKLLLDTFKIINNSM